jgi:multidrug efflux pump subunit AcrA (membrane-fusion protein)
MKKMRKYIPFLGGVLLLAVAILIAIIFIQSKEKSKTKTAKATKIAYTEDVQNKTIPLIISTSGNLTAKNKIELFSEVQGILKISNKDFKSGTWYKKGETIININSDEQFANLQSLKSYLLNALLIMLPDLKIEYPSEYEKWQSYLSNLNLNETTPELPATNSEREKYFIAFRNIYSSYYNVKTQEVRLSKYRIEAPYNGILTEALVTPGSLIRPGQKLGEFIDPSVYEMEVSINAEFSYLLKKGSSVELRNLEHTKTWGGKVVRINGKIDQSSQTVKVFIQVKSSDVQEGMYLEASLIAKSVDNAYELSRTLLVDGNRLYIVKDSQLELVDITPLYFNDKSVVIKGLENGTLVLSKEIPGAYTGMRVKITKEIE